MNRINSDRPLVTIFTDGACSGNPGPGGWAAILIYGPYKKQLSGSSPQTTNNIMELTAAIRALQQLKQPCDVELFSDSQYLIKGMNSWVHEWCKNGWQRQRGKPISNLVLWKELYRLNKKHSIKWHWIPAFHDDPVASCPENALCDTLAKEAMSQYL